MLIELSRGVTIHPGTFTAVIAPEKKILFALNGNRDLRRFLFLYVSGNYSRILTGISRTSGNFEVRRPFTADQLLNVVQESGHTILFVEHDPTLFDGAERLYEPVASALRQAGREALVILWAPVTDRSFAALARQADRRPPGILRAGRQPAAGPEVVQNLRSDKRCMWAGHQVSGRLWPQTP